MTTPIIIPSKKQVKEPRYDKAKIMRMAHKRRKVLGVSMSEALKYTWAIAKESETISEHTLKYYRLLISPYSDHDVDVVKIAKARFTVEYCE